MNYIKSLHIEGFKKFTSLDVQFNEHMNILVGENEAGKSTILDAIKTVLNQQYRNADKSVLRDLFNTQMVTAFQLLQVPKLFPKLLSNWNWSLIQHKIALLIFMEKYMGKEKSKLKSTESDLSVNSTRNSVLE